MIIKAYGSDNLANNRLFHFCRRGFSKFYTGKSQSFTSLSDAGSLDDLAKKETETPYSRRMKMNKSYPGGLDKKQRPICPPTKVISKRQARGSFGGLVSKMSSRSISFQLNSCRVQTWDILFCFLLTSLSFTFSFLAKSISCEFLFYHIWNMPKQLMLPICTLQD